MFGLCFFRGQRETDIVRKEQRRKMEAEPAADQAEREVAMAPAGDDDGMPAVGDENGGRKDGHDGAVNGDAKPVETLYVRNLNERIKPEQMRAVLEALFGQYGPLTEVHERKGHRFKGQRWVVFDDASDALKAVDGLNGFPLFEKPMEVCLAERRSNVKTKADGTWAPVDRMKRKAERDKDGPPTKKGRMNTQSEALVVNRTLFVQDLPETATKDELEAVFGRYAGFREVRLPPGRHGIAFVDYDSEHYSAPVFAELQGYKLQDHRIQVSYAKR